MHFGGPVDGFETVRSIERPYSVVHHLRVRSPSRPGLYLKHYRALPGEPPDLMERQVSSEYSQMLRAHKGLADRDTLAAPRPIAAFPDLHVFVAAEAGGTSLRGLMRRASVWERDGRRLARALRGAGAWLQAYQGLPVTAEPLDPGKMRSYTEFRLGRLRAARHRVVTDRDLDRLRGALEHWLAQLRAEDLSPFQVHGDFNPENVLVHEGRITVIDYSQAHAGARYYDLVQMYLQVERLKARLSFPRGLAARIQQALLDGYGQPAVTSEPLFRLLVIEQLACYLRRITERPPRRAMLTPRTYLRRKRTDSFRTLERLGILEPA
jgi:hypothetical protein